VKCYSSRFCALTEYIYSIGHKKHQHLASNLANHRWPHHHDVAETSQRGRYRLLERERRMESPQQDFMHGRIRLAGAIAAPAAMACTRTRYRRLCPGTTRTGRKPPVEHRSAHRPSRTGHSHVDVAAGRGLLPSKKSGGGEREEKQEGKREGMRGMARRRSPHCSPSFQWATPTAAEAEREVGGGGELRSLMKPFSDNPPKRPRSRFLQQAILTFASHESLSLPGCQSKLLPQLSRSTATIPFASCRC
jgi:hypothetical protein